MTNFSFNRAKIVSISDTFTFQFSLLISRFSPNSRNTTEMNKTHQLNDASSLTRFIFSVKMLKIAFTINVPFVEDLQISTELTWDQFMLSCLSRFVFFFFCIDSISFSILTLSQCIFCVVFVSRICVYGKSISNLMSGLFGVQAAIYPCKWFDFHVPPDWAVFAPFYHRILGIFPVSFCAVITNFNDPFHFDKF